MTDIKKIEPFFPKPEQSVIDVLESMLRDAKSGELRACIFVCDYHTNEVMTRHSAISKNKVRLIGELEYLKHELLCKDLGIV